MLNQQPYYNNNVHRNLGELGIAPMVIVAIIGAVVSLAPLVSKWVGKNKTPADVWSGWDWPTKTQYVQEGLIIAKEAIRQGVATTIEETMQVLIAQVELDESWEVWKERNERFIPMMQQAQTEIDAEMNKTALASILSTNTILWALGLSVIGYGFYWFMNRNKTLSPVGEMSAGQRGDRGVTTKQLA